MRVQYRPTESSEWILVPAEREDDWVSETNRLLGWEMYREAE